MAAGSPYVEPHAECAAKSAAKDNLHPYKSPFRVPDANGASGGDVRPVRRAAHNMCVLHVGSLDSVVKADSD